MAFRDKIYSRLGLATQKDITSAYRKGFVKGTRDYAGAQINRLTADWISSITSIQNDIRMNVVLLRERARDLAKNNPIVSRWLNLCVSNIVGANGFTLQSNVYEWRSSKDAEGNIKVVRVQDKLANIKLEEGFKEWQKPQNCSVSGRYSFRQLCALMVKYKKRDGEAILWKVRNKKGLQLHPITPEALDERKNVVLDNGNVVIMGVEMDKWRRPVNYYFRKIDPYLELYATQAFITQHIVIPANQIIHWYRKDFENQTRGITEMTQVMMMLHHLQGYDEATVVNARASAATGVIYETDIESPSAAKFNDEDEVGNQIQGMEPGASFQLPPGIKAVSIHPEYPTAQYEMYQRASYQKISAGFNTAYASTSNDLSQANFGSNRVALLDERDAWTCEQNDMIDEVLMSIYPDWLEMALLKQQVQLPPEKFDKFNKPIFNGRRWDWIDPLKDWSGILMAMRSGLKSPYAISGALGENLEEILDDLAEFYKLAKEKGVPIDLDAKVMLGAAGQDLTTTPDAEANPKETKNFMKTINTLLRMEELEMQNHSNGNGNHNGK